MKWTKTIVTVTIFFEELHKDSDKWKKHRIKMTGKDNAT